jgi:NADH-dependent peroxiredoxin subunit F
MYDLVIIGAGPAGITAAVYAARKKMSLLVVTLDIGGQTAWSGDIENYTGYQFISGPELAAKFEEHMRTFSIPVREGEKVREIENSGEAIIVRTDKGAYQTHSVIIASGKRSRELNVPGEKEFKNKGLTYCATCDGPLFAGKPVAVIGGGNSALDAAIQLLRICPQVHIVTIGPDFTGDPVMVDTIRQSRYTVEHHDSVVTAVKGEKMVTGITIKKSGKEEELAVKGVFVEIGLVPNSEFATGIEKNRFGEIKVNERNQTNIPGIFAAGDVTEVLEKQIIIAAGEGSKAALGVFHYLIQHGFVDLTKENL